MLDPVSNTPITSGVSLVEESRECVSISVGIGATKDSIEAEQPLKGFSYMKATIMSVVAIVFFSIAAFFANLFYKDDAKQADLDADIAYHRKKLNEANEGKSPSKL